MSFMIADSVVYHCQSCSYSVKVMFVGGAKSIQIGDENVYCQMKLNEKYGMVVDQSESQNFFNQSHQFHVDGIICQNCYEALKPEPEVLKRWELACETLDYLHRQSPKIEEIHKRYSNMMYQIFYVKIERWFEKYSFKQQEPEMFNSIVNDRNIKMPGRFKHLIKGYMHKTEEVYVQPKYATFLAEEESVKILQQYKDECTVLTQEINRCIPDLGTEKFDMWIPETVYGKEINFNPYICAPPQTTAILEKTVNQENIYSLKTIRPDYMRADYLPIELEYILGSAFSDFEIAKKLRQKMIAEVQAEIGGCW